jgi:hypothetical protein
MLVKYSFNCVCLCVRVYFMLVKAQSFYIQFIALGWNSEYW